MHIDFTKNRFSNLIYCQIVSLFCIVSSANATNTIACHPNINISLNEDCESLLSASDVLALPPLPFEPHTLILTDSKNDTIQGNVVTSEHLWTTIMAKVINESTGNSCWGSIKVEDKLPPSITCESVVIKCYDAAAYLPKHDDNCSTSELELLDESIIPNSCDLNNIMVINKLWTAVDGYGNKAEPCMQSIVLQRLIFADIDFPKDLEVRLGTNLTCESVVLDENGFPSIDSTGVPTIGGVPIYPLNDIYCSIGVDYDDFVVNDDDCVQKYMRTWRVYEALCSSAGTPGNFISVPQVIEISDTELPTITCPPSKTISTSGGESCKGTTQLALPGFTDDCSGLVQLDIVYGGPFLRDVKTEPTVVLDIGVNEIKYTIYDACENPATCTTTVVVDDLTGPNARCDDSKIVSLRSSGTAYATVSSFDNGSNDDCAFYKSIIRKETQSCDCELPEFNDMAYVGEFEGKYYYVSTIKRFAFEAFSYSEAFGGELVTVETEAEHDWLSQAVQNTQEGDFLIGLKEKLDDGQFFWNDHSIPSYSNWDMGEPSDNGKNVIVNEAGLWETFNGNVNRSYFVTEFDDICGFSDFVHFCCVDGLEDPTLTIRAIDRFGRYSDCTITVEIQDKVAPVINCPTNRSLDCSTVIDFSNLDVYGVATVTDECLMDDVTSTYTEQISDCGVGEIIRTFVASDPTGQSTCQQVITLNQDFTMATLPIKWPEDYTSTTGCNSGDLIPANLPVENALPDFNGAACSSLEATYTDDEYSFAQSGSDACKKILRNWTVRDACLEGTAGYAPRTYQQTIKVINSQGPTINSGCDDVVVETSNCKDAKVGILSRATDDCTDEKSINGKILIDFNSDGNGLFDLDIPGFDNEIKDSITFEIGSHFVLLDFVDDCGNNTTCAKRITVENNLPPVAACVSGLTSMIQEMDTNGDGSVDSKMVMLFASMLDRENSSLGIEGSKHPCDLDISLSFSSDINDTIATFDCSHIGLTNPLTLWVTDDALNTSVCSTTVIIQDEDDHCGLMTANTFDVNGLILTESKEPLEQVEVVLEGSETPMKITEDDGLFAFPGMPDGGYYSVIPARNDNHLNGVSTLDLVKIQRHILGLEKLDSPYKIIAADVDNSGSVSAIDLIELRKLILGIQSEFSNSESWRIIDGQYEFPDDQNPFINGYPQSYDIFKLDGSMDLEFIGVKVGDVDNSARYNNIQELGKRSNFDSAIKLTVEEKKLTGKNTQTLIFKLEDVTMMDGFQLALDVDPTKIEILGFKPLLDNMNIANVNNNLLDNGDIRISWHNIEHELEKGSALFELMVRPKNNVFVSEVLEIAYEELMPEVYIDNKALPMTINFELKDIPNEKIKLYQNVPNPWSEYTEVKFYTPEAKDFKFNLFDVNGRVVYKQINKSVKGINMIEVDKSMINQPGVMFYEIIIDDVRMMDKMILLN